MIGRLRHALAPPAARVAAVAAACIVLLGAGGAAVVSAADASLPDSPLYRVKETQESAELLLATDDLTRLRLYARQTRRRAAELARAVDAGKPRPVIGTLARRLATSVDQAVEASIRLNGQGNPRPAIRTRALLGEMRSRLEQLTAEASPAVQPPLQRLDAHLDEQVQRLPTRSRRAVPGL
jgi:hypothetical protein